MGIFVEVCLRSDVKLLLVFLISKKAEVFNNVMLALQIQSWVRLSLSVSFRLRSILNPLWAIIILELGTFVHAVEDEMLCTSTMADKVPYFNAPIYLQNKSIIGKVDEILGPINEVYFSVKMGEGMVATSFKKGDKVYVAGDKLLPLERFLPKPKVEGGMWLIFFPSLLDIDLAFFCSRC